jgi:uncharacterized membrane protein YccC
MLPSSRDWIFSIKTFIAALLALYVSLKMELPRPYWSMAAVYVVSSPFVGPTTSKSLYRVLGTMMGGAVAILLVPPLVESPYLLCLAMAVWSGIMVYFGASDRTARSYVFLLASYTTPLLTFPAIFQPTDIFDIAVARTEEIIIGIVIASIMSAVVFPSRLGDVLSTRVATWARDARHYATHSLAGHRPDNHVLEGLRRMAATVNGLDIVLGQLKYDGAHPEIISRAKELRGRMALLMPIITALADPLRALFASDAPDHESQQEKERLTAVAASISAWISTAPEAPDAHHDGEHQQRAQALRSELASLQPAFAQYRNWHGVLLSSVLWRLRVLVDLWEDCVTLKHSIAIEDVVHWQPRFVHWRFGSPQRYFDRGMMVFASVTAVGGIFAECALWLHSNWPDGGVGIAFAAVGLYLFAVLDEPAGEIYRYFLATAVAAVLAGVLLFVFLPHAPDFVTFAIVCAVPLIFVGLYMPSPKWGLPSAIVAFTSVSLLGLQSSYYADPRDFLNQNVGLVIGVGLAYIWTRVTRPFGAELFARRITRSSWQDMALATGPHTLGEQRDMLARSLDRLMQLIPRLAPADDPEHASIAALRDSRVAINTLDLQLEKTHASAPMQAAIERIMSLLREYFQKCANSGARQPVPAEIRAEIDSALGQASRAAMQGLPSNALHALVLLRTSLFQNEVPTLNLEESVAQA